MEYYEFKSRWISIDNPPANGNRCIVTDGEIVTIATYVLSSDNAHWIFGESIEGVFSVIGWMPVPKAMVKPISSI